MGVIMDGIYVDGQKVMFAPEDILSGDVSAYTEEIGTAVEEWLEENVTGGEQVTDTTLTLPGVPADSKKTGDEISALKEDLNDNTFFANHVWEVGRIVNGQDGYNRTTYRTKGYYTTSDIDYVEITDPLYIGSIWYYSDNAGSYVKYVPIRSDRVVVDKSYPYYRLAYSRADYTELPDLSYIVAYRYTDFRKKVDLFIDSAYVASDTAKIGFYRMPESDFSRQRIALTGGVPNRYSASYRVSIINNLTLDYDVTLKCTDPLFNIYGYYYTDGWHYFDTLYTTDATIYIPKNVEFLFTIKRVTEDVSETADIPTFVSKIDFLTEFVIGIEDLKNDIDRFNYPAIDILTANDDAVNKIWASRWLRSATAKPLTLLWFSDVHRWKTQLERIIDFKAYLESIGVLNDTIVTGDLVRNATDEGAAFQTFWYDTEGTDDILIALGNHDHYDVGSQPHGKASFSKMDEMFFQNASEWGAVRESNLPYYYKDYTDQKIRLIIADPAVTSDEADETTWLRQTLEGARTNDFAVIVASHFLVTTSVSIYDNNWSNNLARKAVTDAMTYDWNGCDIVGCVTDFISNGGKFICYMIGHTHTDIVSHVSNHPDQLIINVACASTDRSHETPLTINDLPRYDGTRTQDCFNVITFDAENLIIKCVRVGANVTMYQQPRTAFAYDVNNHEFISLI